MKILIEVKNGVVTKVYTDQKSEVAIVDWDYKYFNPDKETQIPEFEPTELVENIDLYVRDSLNVNNKLPPIKYAEWQVAIECQNQEEIDKVAEIAHEFGLTWNDGDSYKDYVPTNIFIDKLCFDLYEGQYANTKTYKRLEYKIVSASEFIKYYRP